MGAHENDSVWDKDGYMGHYLVGKEGWKKLKIAPIKKQ